MFLFGWGFLMLFIHFQAQNHTQAKKNSPKCGINSE